MKVEFKDFSVSGRPVPKDYVVRVRVAWWVRPYLSLTIALHNLMGTVPNYDVVSRDINRGVRMKLEPVNPHG